MGEKKLPKSSVSASPEQIPSDQLDEGIALCSRNARRLLKDADLLYSNRSYGHALALSVLALEEQGRKVMLMAIKRKVAEIDRELWRLMFRDHEQKLAMSFQIFTESLKKRPSQEELNHMYRTMPHAVAMKNRGLYVDFFNGLWHSPFDADVRIATQTLPPWVKGIIRKTDRWLNF
jgi:AbiV family abortive infection protein